MVQKFGWYLYPVGTYIFRLLIGFPELKYNKYHFPIKKQLYRQKSSKTYNYCIVLMLLAKELALAATYNFYYTVQKFEG